jgi:tetratricopeptide (TPR) repeat protein
MSPFLFVKPKQLTRHGQLRDQLVELEALIGQLGHGLGEEALTIPALFDQITAGLTELQAAGQSTPGETGRLESASAELKRKAGIFLREVGGTRVLRNARSARQPGPAHWWWFLDQVIADGRQAWLQQWLIRGAIAMLLLVILSFAYQQFLAPDAATLANFRHQQRAESLAQTGNWAGALSEVEQALAALPGEPEGLTLKGILQQKLGQSEAAEKTFAVAEAHFGSREEFLIVRAGQFLGVDQNQAALADAQELIAIQPDSAIGHLLLGQTYINLEIYTEAVAAFQNANDLADVQDKPELAASARIQLEMARQMLSASATADP